MSIGSPPSVALPGRTLLPLRVCLGDQLGDQRAARDEQRSDRSRSSARLSLLWIDDEIDRNDPLLKLLTFEGIAADVASSGQDGIAMVQSSSYDAILVDLRLPDLFGLTVLSRLVTSSPRTPVVVVTGWYSEPEVREEAIRRGAAAFLYKPLLGADEILSVLRSIVHTDPQSLSKSSPTFGIVAVSEPMRAVLDWIKRIGPSPVGVLITGETGTGKELVANGLHQASGRGRFVAVNCAAIPEGLIESELFGHQKGAFTGAAVDKKGLFETADGGTLFLDEIGDLRLDMQARLLRALDTGEVRRVGDTSARRIDFRVIAATNVNLRKQVAKGDFREDLYYRLCAAHCRLPPLRERSDDLEALVLHTLSTMRPSNGKQVRGISPGALAILQAYSWPGNVRELRHMIERAALSASSTALTERDVTEALAEAFDRDQPRSHDTLPAESSPGAEVQRIVHALDAHHWNRSEAARSLGISRSTLWRTLRRLRLD